MINIIESLIPGYGNMSPKTDTGRYVTIVYSLLGIPLMALYLAMFSKGFYRFVSNNQYLLANTTKHHVSIDCHAS